MAGARGRGRLSDVGTERQQQLALLDGLGAFGHRGELQALCQANSNLGDRLAAVDLANLPPTPVVKTLSFGEPRGPVGIGTLP